VDVELGGGSPGLASWETVSCPRSTSSGQALRDWSRSDFYPALRAGLSSAVPSGLVPMFPWRFACRYGLK
jgi:hypothetical protein